MVRPNWSITSRTGYARQLPKERIRETIAILCGMAVVLSVITLIVLLSNWLL